ncbi:hypothetical protein KY290_022354 [Solanum tuberosum]|uniref:Uncharacterized protein n=1 Tax=Solanum tuberosum TaxID=4113 RepID=A0ABQ7V463_SOLTU|nr:hypothetical protein KY289_021475 [Solanum tuberosum]KAH0758861.1 hypothetical protein KY290_022354 [Solanum tuberosum]
MSFTQQVSEELGVPNVGFWTASGCSLWAFTQYPKLVEQGYTPIKDEDLKSIGSNLWKEETHCLEWLDTKKPNSVVYVNFGSVTVMSNEQLVEFAWELENTKMNFLWIVRSDLVMGDSAIFPHEFLVETKERGLLGGWCPQE